VVNLHAHGILTGAGGAPESATPLLVFTQPASGGAFDPSVRYGFSFDTVPASCNVHNVNLVGADLADLQTMVSHGWTKFFSGTATYRGDANMGPDGGASFTNYPQSIRFAFGFSDPASYINCENPELGPSDTDRGVQPSASGPSRAQITMHTDHFFWDQTDVEGTPLHFDPIAARAVDFGTNPTQQHSVSLSDLMGDFPTALTDRRGALVADRGLPSLEASMMDTNPPPSYGIGSAGSASVHDLRDFVTYNARGQGHLNSNGLCFVRPTAAITY
jgi:hypothetical protein